MNTNVFFEVKLIYLILILSLALNPVAYAAEETGSIKVIIDGLTNNNGVVKAGLYDDKDSYLSKGGLPSFRSAKVMPQGKETELIFDQVPYGEYTIKIYHDENTNGEVDSGILGIPKEKYGFSNNPKVLLGLPDYDAAKFTLFSNEIVLKITLR
jgi:uncharacterized protein (DUF2141 family)